MVAEVLFAGGRLDSIVPFNLKRIMELSVIEDAEDAPQALVMLNELLEDTMDLVEVIKQAHSLAEENECFGLLNYLEQRLDDHWKFVWMLRATLK